MIKRVVKPEKETPRSSFKPQQQNRFAPRPFPAHRPEPESSAECCDPLFSYSLKDVSTYPRETVQPKLRLGPVGDRNEQEADQVARRVVETISSPEQESVQRQEDLEDEEELDLEEKELRRKVAGIAPAAGDDVGPDLESAIHRARSGGQPLSDGVRQPMERAFGADFGSVRVHADGEADSLNRSIQARALTTGQDVFFRQGEYRPGSSEGQRLLAHELTHVVQQNGRAMQRAQLQATGRVLQKKEEAPPNRTGMPDQLKSGLENLSGMDLSGVRVHYNSSKPAQLNALAYTQGQEIHVAPRQEKHLPHEGWHAVQQMQGRVKPTMQLKDGVPVNDDKGLEHEANVKGALAASHGTQHIASDSLGPLVAPQQAVVQGKWFRMSTLLDYQDEIEVAKIQNFANQELFFDAFWMIVSKDKGLAKDFAEICYRCIKEEQKEAAFNILWETFEEPSKAYTAAEVIEELQNNEIISLEADILAETDNEDDDIESLIAQFSGLHISVPFRSDIDDKKEEHYVSWKKNDIIVESNPKPLKDMIQNGIWENYQIAVPLLNQLDGLRKTAKLELYKVAGNTKRNIVGGRTKKNMEAFRSALDAIAKILSKLGGGAYAATLMPKTDLSTSAYYGRNSSPVEGTHVKAYPLCIKSSSPGSQPVDGRLMKSIRKLAGQQKKSYVQMHLLNDLVFGPGQLWNLTPGPKQSNVDMEKNVEDPLKRAILGKGLVIKFEAKVKYINDPLAANDIQIAQNPDKYRFQWIDFTAKQLEYYKATQSWVDAAVQDPDVAKVNNSRINWRYGSLEPLVPHPRILDPATTLQELISANIQPAAANRIIAFVKANPTWKPKGPNKQKQLALAVKAYDKERTIPNISSWKAKAVLWT